MTSTTLGVILAGIILFGTAVKALPAIWGFVRAAAKAPALIEEILKEFLPNGGNSMRDKITQLGVDTGHLRESSHVIAGNMETVASTAEMLSVKVVEHTREDSECFAMILARLDHIDGGLTEAKDLAAEVKTDLGLAAVEVKTDLGLAATEVKKDLGVAARNGQTP